MKIILVIATALWCVSLMGGVNATVIEPRGPLQGSALEPFIPAGEQLEDKRERRQTQTDTFQKPFTTADGTHHFVDAVPSNFEIASDREVSGTRSFVTVTVRSNNATATFLYESPDNTGFKYVLDGKTGFVNLSADGLINVVTGDSLSTAHWGPTMMTLPGLQVTLTVSMPASNIINDVSEGPTFVQVIVGSLTVKVDYDRVFATDGAGSGETNCDHGHSNNNPGLGLIHAAEQAIENGVGLGKQAQAP